MAIHIKNKGFRGFLVLEAVIALALFSICIFSTITLSFGSRKMFEEARDKETLLNQAALMISDPLHFGAQLTYADYGNDATIAAFSSSTNRASSTDQNPVSTLGSSIGLSILLTPDTFSAYGKDTCPPVLSSPDKASLPISTAFSIPSTNPITDLSVKDGVAYISTNSSSVSDPDVFIVDIADIKNPKLISSLDTGPGFAALVVAGPYIFAANDGSVDQMQILDIHDRSHPAVLSRVKVPLDIASSTAPNASAIFYDKGFVYLGTEKGDSPELTIWNVADPVHPTLAGKYEIGNKVEKIVVAGNRAYVAGTGARQLLVFDISNPVDPILLLTMTPSGWQTQSGQALDLFEGELAFGRDTGGFDNTVNPEFILYDVSSLAQRSSFDEQGGIYGLIDRSPEFLVLTHRSTGQLRLDDASGTTTLAYDIPGIPTAISCDWGNLYVASNNNPSLTLIKDFHE